MWASFSLHPGENSEEVADERKPAKGVGGLSTLTVRDTSPAIDWKKTLRWSISCCTVCALKRWQEATYLQALYPFLPSETGASES